MHLLELVEELELSGISLVSTAVRFGASEVNMDEDMRMMLSGVKARDDLWWGPYEVVFAMR